MAQNNTTETAIAKYNDKMHKTYAWYCENSWNAENIACNFACHLEEDSQFGATQISNLCHSMTKAVKKEVINACLAILQHRIKFGCNDHDRVYCHNLTLVIQYCNE